MEITSCSMFTFTTTFLIFNFQASGSWDKTIRLWNPLNGKLLHILLGHSGWIQAVCFSPDSLYLASACEDETVKIWGVVEGECVKTLEVTDLDFFYLLAN